jgi:lycopene cyclase domain-containing protein
VNYTVAAVLAVLTVVVLDLVVFRTKLLLRKAFWTAYAIVLFFQLIVNGLLTGLPIVRYDPSRIAGLRIIYAPFEDVLFGFALVTLTLVLWVWAGRVGVNRDAPGQTRAARPVLPGHGGPTRPGPGG